MRENIILDLKFLRIYTDVAHRTGSIIFNSLSSTKLRFAVLIDSQISNERTKSLIYQYGPSQIPYWGEGQLYSKAIVIAPFLPTLMAFHFLKGSLLKVGSAEMNSGSSPRVPPCPGPSCTIPEDDIIRRQ